MKTRFPLPAKILLWFFLNLLLLALVGLILLRGQFRFGLDLLVNGRTGEKLQSLASLISPELNEKPREEWNSILKRFGSAYGVTFAVVRQDENIIAGELTELPREVAQRLRERPQPNLPQPGNFRRGENPSRPDASRSPGLDFQNPDHPRPPESTRGLAENEEHPPQFHQQPEHQSVMPPVQPRPRFFLHTSNPSRYWAGVPLPRSDYQRPQPQLVLLVVSETLRGGGLFFDYTPWLLAGSGVIVFSVLFWLPLVRGITRAISQTTRATEAVAEGKFDIRLDEKRRDELGALAGAVNRMAVRLSGFVSGQKRFLGDTAHELCAPIARMQVALGILEERVGEKEKPYVIDVREELQSISNLVNELLSFSKAGLRQKPVPLQSISLLEIARRVAEREGRSGAVINITIPADLRAQAESELLSRTLSNLVRNSIRYAGATSPIEISATREATGVLLKVSDTGPGVPSEALQKIFDPFYRVEESRSRELGGVGLGLAIVRTCVEACGGSVSAANRQPTGLEVTITLNSPAD